MYMSIYTYITANYWCSSEECSMTLIVRTIIPDYQNTNIKNFLLKQSQQTVSLVRLIGGQIFTLQMKTCILEK